MSININKLECKSKMHLYLILKPYGININKLECKY